MSAMSDAHLLATKLDDGQGARYELSAIMDEVWQRHPDFTERQCQFEARMILAYRLDHDTQPLDADDIAARLAESEAAHDDEANSRRAFTKKAMVN